MDMFGPLYQVMFSSMTTRAAHLDLANDKTADAFFMAFLRFASLRGHPRVCWSDCATNYLVAQSYLKKIMQTGTFPRCRVFYVRNPPMISNGNGIYLTQVIRMASWKLLLSPSDKVSKLHPRIKPLRRNDGEHFSRRQPTSSTNALCIHVLTTSGKLHPSHRTIFLLVNIFRPPSPPPTKSWGRDQPQTSCEKYTRLSWRILEMLDEILCAKYITTKQMFPNQREFISWWSCFGVGPKPKKIKVEVGTCRCHVSRKWWLGQKGDNKV